MTKDDYQQLASAIKEHWPREFKPDVIAEFCQRLDHFPIDAVLKVLTQWKSSKIWAPKLPEVIEKLRGVATNARGYRTSTARAAVSAHPHMNGRPEAEIIVRNYRALLRFRGRNAGTGSPEFFTDESLDTEFHAFLARRKQKLAEAAGTPEASLIADSIIGAEVMYGRLPLLRAACIGDLITAGFETEPAERAAEWITAPLHEFKTWCEEAGSVREEAECPV